VLEYVPPICNVRSNLRSSEIIIEFLGILYLVYGSFGEFEIPTESIVWREDSVLDASDLLSETDKEELLEERSEVLILPDREDVFFELEEEVIPEIESDFFGKFRENPFRFFADRGDLLIFMNLMFFRIFFIWCDFCILPYLTHEKSSGEFLVGPESFLEEDLETLGIAISDRFDHAFVFDLVEGAGRVEEFTTGFERTKGGIEEFGLESRYGVDIFEIPVSDRLRFFEPDAFTRTWRIEEDTIKCFGHVTIKSPVIIRDSSRIGPHSLDILHELCHPITSWFIGDDSRIGIMLT